jgi:hypothetical protein
LWLCWLGFTKKQDVPQNAFSALDFDSLEMVVYNMFAA